MKLKKVVILLVVLGFASSPLVYYGLTKENLFWKLRDILMKERTISVNAPFARPDVAYSIQETKEGKVLIIQWSNVTSGTTHLKVYRAKAGTTDWVLWKTINLSEVALGGPSATGVGISGTGENGSISILLGPGEEIGYVYYAQGVSVATDSTGTPGGASEQILWESTSTTPTAAPTSSAPAPPTAGSPPPESTPPPTSTSTPTQPTPAPAPTSTSPPPPPSPSTPTGIPYYTPQGTISGYVDPPTGSFWVQRTNNQIDINWQNLPTGTDSFTVSRSPSNSGPWTAVLTQKNPPQGGPYSIKILDSTLNDPYYYKMEVYSDSSLLATYGPVYLAGQ